MFYTSTALHVTISLEVRQSGYIVLDLRLECEYSILEYLRVFFKGVLDGEDINL